MEYLGVLGGGPGFTRVLGVDGNEYTVRGTFGFRNNNPGNVRASPFAQRHGAIGESGGFAVFPSYEVGRAAKEALMWGPSYAGMTLKQAITKYAPPNENNTGAYINTIAKALGISPDTNLAELSGEQRSAMLDTMQDIEGYREGPITDALGNPVDPGIMSAMFDAPTPEAAPRWNSAVPGEVERTELTGLPGDLAGPAVTPSEGYGMLAQTMSQTPSLGLSGTMPADRMASGPVAQGVDGLRAGLLSQQPDSMYASQPEMADLQQRANAMTGIGGQGLLSYGPEAPASPAAAAIEAVAPSAAPASSPSLSLASAYGQLGQTLDQAGVLGLGGQKLYDMNAPMGELVDTQQTAGITQASAPPSGAYVDPQVSIQGPATPAAPTQQGPTPPAEVGSFPAAPQTTGQKAKKFAGTVAGTLLGGALLGGGPVGPMIGGILGREMMSGKGLFSGSRQPQSVAGLLSGMGAAINNIGQGAQQSYSVWGGGTPAGTQASATDGSRITSLGGGMLARTDRNGVTTTFNERGNIVDSPVSSGLGGLISGIGRDFSEAFGGGSSSGGSSGLSRPDHPGLW